MFKLTHPICALTTLSKKDKWLAFFGNRMSNELNQFFRDNWNSIDGIEIKGMKGENINPNDIHLYEIKFTNCSRTYSPKVSISKESEAAYNKAAELGCNIHIVKVIMQENWTYSVDTYNFSRKLYYIGPSWETNKKRLRYKK